MKSILLLTLTMLVGLSEARADDHVRPACPPTVEDDVECYQVAIKDFLSSWVNAWAGGHVMDYLDHYLPGSSPTPAKSYQDWRSDRIERIQSKDDIALRLELDSMMVKENGLVEVVFKQYYHSPSYQDEVYKRLELFPQGTRFFIVNEVSAPDRAALDLDDPLTQVVTNP